MPETNFQKEIAEKFGDNFQPDVLNQFNSDLNKNNYRGAKEAINQSNLPPAELAEAEKTLDEHLLMTKGIEPQKNGEPVTPERLEKKLEGQLNEKIVDYAESYDVGYQCNELLDELYSAVNEAIKIAETHKMKKIRAKDTWFPLVAPIQSLLQGSKYKRIMKKVNELYLRLPENQREKRLEELLDKDKVSHRGQKALAAGSALKVGGVGLLFSPLAGLGLLSLASGITTSIVGQYKTYTSVADSANAINDLTELKERIKTFRGGAQKGEYQKEYIGGAASNLVSMKN